MSSIIIKNIINKISARSFERIWFRDDDVGKRSKKFYKLNKLFKKYNIQICYAVIPNSLCQDVQECILKNRKCLVFQHGYSHQNNSKTNKMVELSDDVDAVYLKSLMLKGKEQLQLKFAGQFKEILVPPYNNIDEKIQDKLKDYYEGCSTYKHNKTKFKKMFNPNCDIVDWENNNVTLEYISSQIDKVQGNILGVVIHHKYIDKLGFKFLNKLLKYIVKNKIVNDYTETNL